MNIDNQYMARAIELAKLAKGKTATNPMVGCVIVENEEIIGEGYHKEYGSAHAEVNAINSVKDKTRLQNATLYVNLEPCSHYGKTPPCTEIILKYSIPNVVIGCMDSFSKVNGKGIEVLRNHGVDVKVGILEEESKKLNRRFFLFHKFKRPYIILKWAQTCDGYIDNDRDNDTPATWLTGERCREIVHKMRAEETAIMVGSKTVERDNPSLTVRNWSGRNPTRLVIDRNLKLSKDYNIFNSDAETLIINSIEESENKIKVDFSSSDSINIMMHKLYERGINSMIVEGGKTILDLFIDNNLYDEAIIFISPLSLSQLAGGKGNNGIKAPKIPRGDIDSDEVLKNIIIKKIAKNYIY